MAPVSPPDRCPPAGTPAEVDVTPISRGARIDTNHAVARSDPWLARTRGCECDRVGDLVFDPRDARIVDCAHRLHLIRQQPDGVAPAPALDLFVVAVPLWVEHRVRAEAIGAELYESGALLRPHGIGRPPNDPGDLERRPCRRRTLRRAHKRRPGPRCRSPRAPARPSCPWHSGCSRTGTGLAPATARRGSGTRERRPLRRHRHRTRRR